MAITRLSINGVPGKPYNFAKVHTGLFTELSVTATPGRRHSFAAKTPAGEVPHTGDFTRLSVTGTPGPIRTFIAKDTGGHPGMHIGDFTRLSVLGVPGRIHTFECKTCVPITKKQGGGAVEVGTKKRWDQLLREDQELLCFMAELVTKNIL